MSEGAKFLTQVFLRENVFVEPRQSGYDDYGVLHIADEAYGNDLTLYGKARELRKVADELHKLADEVERDVRRQRALDNPPRIRRKFVLEGGPDSTIISTAA